MSKNSTFTHRAFDVYQSRLIQKQLTELTQCGVRVPSQLINNVAPTCPACIAEQAAATTAATATTAERINPE